jgi:hypothetical protein
MIILSVFSYNKVPLNIGDVVYQLNPREDGISVIEWTITGISVDGKINVETTKFDGQNRQTVKRNGVNPANFHTQKAELIMAWHSILENQWRDIQVLASEYITDGENI